MFPQLVTIETVLDGYTMNTYSSAGLESCVDVSPPAGVGHNIIPFPGCSVASAAQPGRRDRLWMVARGDVVWETLLYGLLGLSAFLAVAAVLASSGLNQ